MKESLAERLFHLKANGTTVRTECFAGLTTIAVPLVRSMATADIDQASEQLREM